MKYNIVIHAKTPKYLELDTIQFEQYYYSDTIQFEQYYIHNFYYGFISWITNNHPFVFIYDFLDKIIIWF